MIYHKYHDFNCHHYVLFRRLSSIFSDRQPEFNVNACSAWINLNSRTIVMFIFAVRKPVHIDTSFVQTVINLSFAQKYWFSFSYSR